MLTGELGAIAEVIEEIDLQVLPKPTALPILMTAIAVAIAKTHRAREGKLPNAPCRILVIDDDPAVLDFLCEALRESGCQVEGVTSGREGLSRIVMGAPDVVVLDLRMPDVDGQHILGRLRFFAPTLPVVVVTGYDDPSLAQQVLAAGAQHYLTKPVDLDRLGAAVADALSRGQRP
jgi:CheY-like chemotaxis protein